MRRRNAQTAFLATCIIAAAGLSPSAANPLVESERDVRVRTVGPEPVTGRLSNFSLSSEAVVVARDATVRIPARDIISMEWTDLGRNVRSASGGAAPTGRDVVRVVLANGDRLAGRLGPAGSELLTVETADFGALSFPLERVESIRFAAADPSHVESSRWFDRSAPSEDDAVLLTNGDVVRGFITSIDREGINIGSGGSPGMIPLRLAVAARFVHPPADPPSGLVALVTFLDGSRLTLPSLEWTDRTIQARTDFGAEIKAPAERLEKIAIAGGRWKWLSDLTPISAEHTPMLALDWEYRKDRNVLGNELVVAGRSYERGIGVHSRSRLIFELKGECSEFVTSLGMDDDSGPAADVSVAILVDGKTRFQKSGLRRGELHGPVRIDVAKAGRIELLVDFGENGDIQDRFNWIEPGLVRP